MKDNYLLFGGWSRNTETYRKLVDTAPNETKVYIIPHTSLFKDLNIPPSFDKINANILQILKELNFNHITLIGHSLGGALAISFTSYHPDRIKRLILVDSEGIPDKRNFLIVFISWIKDSMFIHGIAKAKENIKSLFRIIQNLPYYFAVARFAIRIDIRSDAQKIKKPSLILWGEKDNVVPAEKGKELKRLIKRSKLVILKSMDHDWLIHSPEELWSNIEKES